jgi:hypothetical protein
MPDDRRVDFTDLNWLGKTVFIGGAALRLTANLLDRAADRASRIAIESRRAYEREMDPNIQEATILEETPGPGPEDGADAPDAGSPRRESSRRSS